MRSLFELANVPGEIQVTIFALAIILIIGFFASGIDLGIFKIPEIPRNKRLDTSGKPAV